MGIKMDGETRKRSYKFAIDKVTDIIDEARADDNLNFFAVADGIRHFIIRFMIEAAERTPSEIIERNEHSVYNQDIV